MSSPTNLSRVDDDLVQIWMSKREYLLYLKVFSQIKDLKIQLSFPVEIKDDKEEKAAELSNPVSNPL